MMRSMESPTAIQADSEGMPDVNVEVSSPVNGRKSASLSTMASVDWSQHRVFFSRYDRTALEKSQRSSKRGVGDALELACSRWSDL